MIKLWLGIIRTIFKRKKRVILSIVIVLGLIIVFLLKFFNSFSRDLVIEGLVGTYVERDLPETVTVLISENLVNVDESGTPKPGLAQSWEVLENGTVYKLKLKDNLNWSDGTKLKASDINIAIPGSELKTPDEGTLEFKIADSFSPFLTLLKKPVLKKESLVGVGPYQVTQVKKDGLFIKRLTLQDSGNNLPDVQIKFYPNEKTAKNALKLGEIQSLLGVSELGDLPYQSHLAIYSKVKYDQVVTIFYNTKDPILSEDNLRLGLSYGAPVIKEEVEAVTSISPKSWAFNSSVKDFLEKPNQAKVSLDKVKNGKESTITLTATSSLKNVGERVVEVWRGLGINAVLRVESGIPQNFQALLITQNIPLDPDQYSLWHSTQLGTNISQYGNPRIDKDLEDGRKLADLETRKQRYQDFQKVLLDHSPATFLYFPKYNVVYFKKIEEPLKRVLERQL